MYINIETHEYPLSARDIKRAHPNMSFPKKLDEATITALGYATVQPTTRPDGDILTEGQPELVDGTWQQTWDVRSYTAEEAAAKLEQAKEQAFQRINDGYNEAVAALVSTYPEREEATFTKQEAEAVAWAADNAVATPFLDALMQTRTIDKAELVSRILAKAATLAAATGQMTGKRQTLEGQVEGAATREEVEAVVW